MVDKAQHQHEIVWKGTVFDLPRRCPSPGALYSLWDHSWENEKRMLGDKANITLHVELFLRNIHDAKYCDVDAQKTLQRREWKDFFTRRFRGPIPKLDKEVGEG